MSSHSQITYDARLNFDLFRFWWCWQRRGVIPVPFIFIQIRSFCLCFICLILSAFIHCVVISIDRDTEKTKEQQKNAVENKSKLRVMRIFSEVAFFHKRSKKPTNRQAMYYMDFAKSTGRMTNTVSSPAERNIFCVLHILLRLACSSSAHTTPTMH